MFIATEDRQPKETHGEARRRSALPTRSLLRGSFYCEQRSLIFISTPQGREVLGLRRDFGTRIRSGRASEWGGGG